MNPPTTTPLPDRVDDVDRNLRAASELRDLCLSLSRSTLIRPREEPDAKE